MPYSTLDQVKKWLKIDPADTSEDTVLKSFQEEANRAIDNILSKFTTVPITDPDKTPILGDIEALWAAGLYRVREEQRPDIPEQQWSHPFIELAKKRLYEFIDANYAETYFGVT